MFFSCLSAGTDPRFRSLSFVSGIQSMPAEIKASVESKAKALLPSLEVSQMKPRELKEEPKTKCSRSIWDMLGGEDDDDQQQNDVVEVNIYYSERPVRKSENPLEWWKANSSHLPILEDWPREFFVSLVDSGVSRGGLRGLQHPLGYT